ncbi:MAG: bifunctional 23S rRNA (guanine(2069)-N(7))-methyltransferase RlmK/23S rRNA (guanine(2445)-N(2))-methyltransferase RlmL [Eggerthellaceae bacterium]|nr:bifunctional 23S rRNA (guanine(2069)-N(7))-methyltransferase RlmK/23S rRNA (guanine(2445)-N(2))-methyltransferase RlmL [Eggerthellaceae bacterium]
MQNPTNHTEKLDSLEFFAPCPQGLSALAAQELRAMRIKVRPVQTGVGFFGSIADAYRVCLFARTVSRVLLVLARFDASDGDTLYRNACEIPWEEHVPHGATIAVSATGTNDNLRNTQFTALRLKDAICDRLRETTDERPDVSRHDADLTFTVALRGNRATVSFNLAGQPLHQRNYRLHTTGVAAPLKETLAAGMLLLADWPQLAREGQTFLDPMCGSGTIAIEAAMIAADIAPGLLRTSWGFTAWKQHDALAWEALVDEAHARRDAGLKAMPPIIAQDIDPIALDAARENAREAHLDDFITFACIDACTMQAAPASSGLIATNPPYGERLFAQAQLPALYAGFSSTLRKHFQAWSLAIITPDESIDNLLGLAPNTSVSVFNGPIPTQVRLYDCAQTRTSTLATITVGDAELTVFDGNSQQFANRLKRRFTHLRKWARRNDIHCYRTYDADLPDYNVAIDLYECSMSTENVEEGSWFAIVYEYAAPSSIDPFRAQQRICDVLAITPSVLGIESSHVFFKQRKRTGGQYRADEQRTRFIITTKEHGLHFELNLSDYLDTGLFLDHRLVRELIQKRVASMIVENPSFAERHPLRFLNLFCYTGSATVHAAAGGALKTTSVDLSQTYLACAQRNMQLNGFTGKTHRFERADCMQWIKEARREKQRWDLIFVDPPAFSNSKKMGKRIFDIQRDHVELLVGVSRLLARGGQAIFSCNLRTFKPDYEALEKLGVELIDITEQTIDEDFSRNQRIHHCFILNRIARNE